MAHRSRGITNLDFEGYELKATFNGKYAGEEYIHVIKCVAILLRLTLVLNTKRQSCTVKQR